MKRLIILAALLLSVVGGLTLMSSTSPLAAQTDPSATRSFEPASVEPGGTVTVHIDIEGVAVAGSVTETVPAGFTYVSTTGLPPNEAASNLGMGILVFPFSGSNSFSYELTAPSMEDAYPFSGILNPGPDTQSVDVGGAASVRVETIPEQTGPAVVANNLKFDIVSDKAVKDARVSGVGYPIGSNALKWVVEDTDMTLGDFDGDLGDFEVRQTDSGEFGLFVSESGAAPSGGSQSISVDLTYTNADGDQLTSTLRGVITSQEALAITSAGPFTIPQGISADTPIGAFAVKGRISDEYLDGILTGEGSYMFSVRDDDMTLVYRSGDLEVKTYSLSLTVSGDAGLANRTVIEPVTINVTASNMAPTVPTTFTKTIYEDLHGTGLVSAYFEVGDASEGVASNDGDILTYSLDSDGDAVFDIINSSSGMITVGEAGIPDSADGGDVDYSFMITVSDGVTANDKNISATVTVDANEPTQLVGDSEIAITREVTAGDVPQELVNLQDLVSDADGDDVTFTISNSPAHIVHDKNADGDDVLRLTYIPDGAKIEARVNTITVGVSDGFNDDPDQTLVITVSVKELEPPPITSNFVSITVAENSMDCMQDGSMGCSVAGVIANGVSYSIESGVDGGDTDFAVDGTTGAVTVLSALDYEDGKNPAFLVNVQNDLSELAGLVSVRVTITDVNEVPVFAADSASEAAVSEDAQNDAPVATFTATDQDAGDTIAYSIMDGAKQPFSINSDGELTVKGDDAFDINLKASYELTIVASDGALSATHAVKVTIDNANDAPSFDAPLLEITIPENTAVGTEIADYEASDPDGDALTFTIKTQTDTGHFGLVEIDGKLSIATGLDYETQQVYLVEINVSDPFEAEAEIQVLVTVTNVNDESPKFNVMPPAISLTVAENTARGALLANYAATDADGDTVKYTLSGDDAKSFAISQTGDLLTLESLDSDSGTPCGSDGCSVTVVASDMPGAASGAPTSGHEGPATAAVVITVSGVEDSISTPHITKANPVPGVGMGKSGSALAGLKVIGDEYLWNMLDCPRMLDLVGSADEATYCKMWDGLNAAAKGVVSAKLSAPLESPSNLPATYGDDGKGPANFVETEWANWGTVLRIEVTAESPDANCGVPVGGNNNQCVELIVKSDSADDVIHLAAYRSNEQENRYVAAVMLVELEAHASNYALNSGGDEVRIPIYKHQRVRNVVPSAAKTNPALQVPRLQVDEEDEIKIEFHNLRADIDVENEPPEISNVSPEHEAAFDDADVEYTFSVSDDNSGLPEPEDLPDTNGDEDYTPVVGLVSDRQCVIDDPDDGVLARAIHIHESEYLDCGDNAQDGEYIANEGGWGFAPIRDDRDFDETSDGFDVETTLVLVKNEIFYVTFIACDRAGNCASYDPDGNDNDVELAKITIDTEVPEFVEARTGVKWDSSDNEYGDDRSFIQVIFDDLTPLNEETVEADDFVVQGHTVKAVYVYSPDDEDTLWADENSDGTLDEGTDPTRYANGGPNSEWGDRGALYRKIDRTVFLELEDELLADETPDVTIIPNGVEDQAGNEQDDGDVEAKDWIAPRFTIISIVAADTPEGASNQLAGDGDEVTVMVTSDERLDQTRPEVTVTYVDASMVDTKGTATCGTDGKRKRGEITMNTAGKTSTKCADNQLWLPAPT